MSDRLRPLATSSQTVGPFFHFGLTANAQLGDMAPRDAAGERIHLRVCVLDGAGDPVPDAMIELYQADAAGRYPDAAGRTSSFSGFGRLPTGAEGCCVFRTIKPGIVRVGGTEQAPHVNVCLLARGLLRQIYTRIYFKDDPALATDPLLALVATNRRPTLLAAPSATEPGVWEFVIRMQGEAETVFFDL